MKALRSNGLPALCDLPIRFKRRPGTPGFEKLVGKETDRKKYAPHEYVSEDGRWIIRATHHTGHGSTNSGRVRWHVSFDGGFVPVGYQNSDAHSLEDAIDDIHRRIGGGVRDGFKVLAKMRQAAEAAQRASEKRTADLVKARELLQRIYGADPTRMAEALAAHVDLDAFARAVNRAEEGRVTVEVA